MQRTLGKHLIAELWVKRPHVLDNPETIRSSLIAAAKSGGFSVIHVNTHAFSPHGVTAVALLAESHMSIHTWPEYAYAAVDIFTCGGRPLDALHELERRLDVERMDVQQLDRGLVGEAASRSAYSSGYRAVDIS